MEKYKPLFLAFVSGGAIESISTFDIELFIKLACQIATAGASMYIMVKEAKKNNRINKKP